MSERSLSEAERALRNELAQFQQRATRMWLGLEKEAVIAITRILDYYAAWKFQSGSGNSQTPDPNEKNREYVLRGAAEALKPFLPLLKGKEGGVPWIPMHADVVKFAFSYLQVCGRLSHLCRLASLERHGVVSTSMISESHLVIKTYFGAAELSNLSAIASWINRNNQKPASDHLSENQWRHIHRRMRKYVDTSNGWFIRYENDSDIVEAYRGLARDYGKQFLESEAFPDHVMIGGRSFGDWKEVCNQALGRIICHIDFCCLLQKKNKNVALENVLTIFARRDDVDAVWLEAGLLPQRLDSTMRALTLDADNIDGWAESHETPSNFYLDFGRNFVLLPCFGALNNSYFALFRHLRQTYKSDWDRNVDLRESIFRQSLAAAFHQQRFLVPPNGFQLRRQDGSTITDLDAVILDKSTGTLALVQLKWHDIFGLSIPERESRKRNIAKANDWIEKVSAWVAGRSSREIARSLNLSIAGSDSPPVLYVVARYTARFSGDEGQDPRAAWLGWFEILHALSKDIGEDPLSHIPFLALDHQASFTTLEPLHEVFKFPNLTIDLEVEPLR